MGKGIDIVFPATVGMNREINSWAAGGARVPRDRGDEPLASDLDALDGQCSPRPWG